MAICLNRSMAPAGSPVSVFEEGGGHEVGVTGRLAAGELGGQRPPCGYGRVEFLLGQETLADLKEDSWHSWVERILSDELAPGRARLGISSPVQMVGGDQKLGVENGALGIALWGPLGKLARYPFQAAMASLNFCCPWRIWAY